MSYTADVYPDDPELLSPFAFVWTCPRCSFRHTSMIFTEIFSGGVLLECRNPICTASGERIGYSFELSFQYSMASMLGESDRPLHELGL